MDKAKIINPNVIIDFGAGTGFFSIQFSNKFKDTKIYACDISTLMLEWIQENVVPEYSNIFPIEIKDSIVPLETDIADFLYMINLHHELNTPRTTLLECFRLLKTGGKIAISDWKKKEMKMGPSYEIRVTEEETKNDLKSAGFKNIEIFTELDNNFLIIAEK